MRVLETERLVLRWLGLDDAAFILELLNQPGWKRFIGDRGVDSLDAARAYLERVPMASYQQHGFGLYAVERKSDGVPVGMCGLIKRDGLDDVDVGFALLSRFEGQGFAREAASATLSYARDVLGLDRVVAITAEDNARSAHVLEHIGMACEGTIRLSPDGELLRLYGTTSGDAS